MIRPKFFNDRIGVLGVLQDFGFVGVGQGWERISVLRFWCGCEANTDKAESLAV
jgi:hypothetical protein